MLWTLKEISERSTTSKDNHCCDNPPLFNIPQDNKIVVDELHLMLRVTDFDWKFGQWIFRLRPWRRLRQKKGGGKQRGHTSKTLFRWSDLVAFLLMCGNKEMLMGKPVANNWTSLLGSDKKILLADLPSRLHNTLCPETVSTVVEIWILDPCLGIWVPPRVWNPDPL